MKSVSKTNELYNIAAAGAFCTRGQDVKIWCVHVGNTWVIQIWKHEKTCSPGLVHLDTDIILSASVSFLPLQVSSDTAEPITTVNIFERRKSGKRIWISKWVLGTSGQWFHVFCNDWSSCSLLLSRAKVLLYRRAKREAIDFFLSRIPVNWTFASGCTFFSLMTSCELQMGLAAARLWCAKRTWPQEISMRALRQWYVPCSRKKKRLLQLIHLFA